MNQVESEQKDSYVENTLRSPIQSQLQKKSRTIKRCILGINLYPIKPIFIPFIVLENDGLQPNHVQVQ